jgi:ketosteroid isomerase-like protein
MLHMNNIRFDRLCAGVILGLAVCLAHTAYAGSVRSAIDAANATGDKSGKTADQGTYMVVWRHEDGKWRLFRDNFASSVPPPKK